MSAQSPSIRAVVDHNLFVSGLISAHGLPSQLISQFRQDAYVLVTSAQLRSELEEVLRRDRFRTKYGLTPEEVADFLFLVDTKALFVRPIQHLPVTIRDPKDAIVLATALGGRADYVVSGDDDLLSVAADPRLGDLRIRTVREFLEVLSHP